MTSVKGEKASNGPKSVHGGRAHAHPSHEPFLASRLDHQPVLFIRRTESDTLDLDS
jgi:hypothetical protein